MGVLLLCSISTRVIELTSSVDRCTSVLIVFLRTYISINGVILTNIRVRKVRVFAVLSVPAGQSDVGASKLYQAIT